MTEHKEPSEPTPEIPTNEEVIDRCHNKLRELIETYGRETVEHAWQSLDTPTESVEVPEVETEVTLIPELQKLKEQLDAQALPTFLSVHMKRNEEFLTEKSFHGGYKEYNQNFSDKLSQEMTSSIARGTWQVTNKFEDEQDFRTKTEASYHRHERLFVTIIRNVRPRRESVITISYEHTVRDEAQRTAKTSYSFMVSDALVDEIVRTFNDQEANSTLDLLQNTVSPDLNDFSPHAPIKEVYIGEISLPDSVTVTETKGRLIKRTESFDIPVTPREAERLVARSSINFQKVPQTS